MKVAFLAPNFPPEVHAGTELAVSALGMALQRRGVEVVVATSSDEPHDGQDVIDERYEGMRVIRLKRRDDEWDQATLRRPRLLRLVGEFVAAERPDVVHQHSMSVFGTGHVEVARQHGVPTVITCHDLWVTCPRYFRLPAGDFDCPTDTDRTVCVRCVNTTLGHPDERHVLELLQLRAQAIRAEAEAAAVLSAPSATAAALIEACMPSRRRVAVVPHGLLAGRGIAPAPAPRPGERLRVGTFGNLVAAKGVLELVRALAGIDCELHLGGAFFESAFANAVRAEADRLGVAMVWHGPYGPGVPHPAQRLHLAVFPSKCQETYGLVVDEALAHGLPVVVSDKGALQERAATGGVVVTSLPALGATLHALLADRARLQQLRAAVPARLPTIDDAAARWLELYAEARNA